MKTEVLRQFRLPSASLNNSKPGSNHALPAISLFNGGCLKNKQGEFMITGFFYISEELKTKVKLCSSTPFHFLHVSVVYV